MPHRQIRSRRREFSASVRDTDSDSCKAGRREGRKAEIQGRRAERQKGRRQRAEGRGQRAESKRQQWFLTPSCLPFLPSLSAFRPCDLEFLPSCPSAFLPCHRQLLLAVFAALAFGDGPPRNVSK